MAKKLNRNLVGGLTFVGMVLLAGAGFALLANLPGRDPKVYEEEARKHEEKGEYDLAAATYQRAFQRDPAHNPEYLVRAARCALEDGKVPAARDMIREARIRDPNLRSATELMTELEFEVAKLFSGTLQWNRVLEEARKLEAIDKNSAKALHAMGQAYLFLQGEDESNHDKAQAALQRALELDPHNADVVELAARDRWTVAAGKRLRGQKAEAESLEQSARAIVSAAIEKCPPDQAETLLKLRRLWAVILLVAGETDKGIAELHALLDKDTKSVETHLYLSTVYSGGGGVGLKPDLAKAEEVLKKAIAANPKEARAYQNLGLVYKLQRDGEKDDEKRRASLDKEEALCRDGLDSIPKTRHFRSFRDNIARVDFIRDLFLMQLDRAILAGQDKAKRDEALAAAENWISVLKDEIDANSREVHFVTAALHRARGEIIEATNAARAADRMNGAEGDVRLQLLLTDLFLEQQQWGLARDAIKKAIALRPDVGPLRLRLAQVLLRLNEPALAMLELKPKNPGPIMDFMNTDKQASALRVEAYRQLGQIQLAREEIQKEAAAGDTVAELRDVVLLMAEGRHADAEVKLKPILAREPGHDGAIRAMFRIYEVMERKDEARAFVKSLLERDPSNRTHRQLQLVLMINDKAPEEKVLEFLSQDKDPFTRALSIADFHASHDRPADAMKVLDEAEAIRPDDPAVVDRQLRVALAAKDWTRAEKYVARDAALNKDGTEGKLARGRMAFAKGDPAEAVTLISEGLQKYPNNALGWTYLGEAYLAGKRLADARAAFTKALEIDPTNGFANRGLADLSLRDGDEKGALRHLEAATRALPDDRWTQRQMQIFKEKENPDRGILAREKIRKDNPKDLENLVLLARLYADPKVAKYDKAAEAYTAALEQSGNDLKLAREVARFYGREDVNRPTEGHALLEGLLRKEQENSKKALVAVCLGQFYELQKSLATADRYIRLAVNLDASPEVLNSAGEFYSRTNRYRDAVEYYKKLLEKISSDPAMADNTKATLSRIIALWLAIGDLDNAKQDIDRYMARYPGDTQGMIYEGAYQRIGGDIQKAKEAFDAHLEKDPNNAVALWQRGQMYMLMGKWQNAIDDLRKAKTFNPDGFMFQHRISLADALIEAGRGEEAVVELRSVLDQHPDQSNLAEALIDAYMRLRPPKYSEAENIIYTYLRRYPKEHKWPMLLGRLGENSKNHEKAIEGYEKASELARDVPEVTAALIAAYQAANKPQLIVDFAAEKVSSQQLANMPLQLAALGWAYQQVGQKEKAVEMYDRAMAAAGQNFLAYLRVINAMADALGREEVLARARSRAEADPENIEKQKMLVHLLQMNGKHDEALKVSQAVGRMAVRDQDVVFAELAQGMLLESLGRHGEAKARYEATLKLDPKHPIALNNLAFLLAEQMNNPAEALPYAQQANRLDPTSSEVLDTYGRILALNNRTGEALGTLLRALDIDRENISALYHLGLVYMDRKEYEDAGNRLKRARELAEAKADQRFLPKIMKALEDLQRIQP
jgi:tetratricopeptide (TPR) repeat protein